MLSRSRIRQLTRCCAILAAISLSIAYRELSQHAAAATVNWINDADGDWETVNSWSSNPLLPSASDDVVIDVGGSTARTITINGGSKSIRSITSQENLNIDGGDFTVGVGGGTINGNLNVGVDRTLSVNGGTLNANGTATIASANLSANNGGVLNLSHAIAYAGQNYSGQSVQASGDGSKIDLTGLTTFTGGGCCGRVVVSASDGGEIDLSNLLSATDNVSFQITGTDSRLKLGNVTSLESRGTQINPPSGIFLSQSAGGILELPNLRTLTGVGAMVSDGGTLNLSSVTVFNGVDYAFSSLQRFEATGEHSRIDLTGLTTFNGSDLLGRTTFLASSGGEVDLSNLPLVKGNATFIATGAGSRIKLSGVSALDASGVWPQVEPPAGIVLIQSAGGIIDLPSVHTLSGVGGTVSDGGMLNLSTATTYTNHLDNPLLTLHATDPGSTLDLSGLSSFSSTGHVGIIASNGGTVKFGNGNITVAGNITFDASTGQIPFGNMTIASGSTISASGNLSGNISSAGAISTPAASTLTVNGAMTSSGTFTFGGGSTVHVANGFNQGATGQLRGTGTLHANLQSAGRVAPGYSPGVITIDGNYTQTATGTLEIEFGGLTPGTDHDQLIVTGQASLAGRLELPIVNNFHPQVNDEITFLTGNPVIGQFDSPIAPNLQTYNQANGTNLGFAVVYGANDVKLRVVNRTDVDFVSISQTAHWSTPSAWSTGALPTETNRITIENLYDNNPSVHQTQTVEVDTSTATTNELHISDASDPIKLRILSGNNLATQTGVFVEDNATIELEANSHLNGASVTLQSGGKLSGAGTVAANLMVTSGTLNPGIDVGHLDVAGNYQQSAGGTLHIEIADSGGFTQFDTVAVTGSVQLGGKFQIDASGVTSTPPSGSLYPIITGASVTGTFAAVNSTGNSNVYFREKTIGSTVYAESEIRGDMDGVDGFNSIDYDLFAYGLINPSLSKFHDHCLSVSPASACTINPQQGGDFSGNGRLDFDDIALFQARLNKMGYPSAQLMAAIDRSTRPVPEPASCISMVFGGLLLAISFDYLRIWCRNPLHALAGEH